jgi:hypothetical protein
VAPYERAPEELEPVVGSPTMLGFRYRKLCTSPRPLGQRLELLRIESALNGLTLALDDTRVAR